MPIPFPTPTRTALCSGLLLAAVAAPGVAAPEPSISLHEALVRTLEQNPELRAFDYRIEAQQGRLQQAGVAPSPEWNLELEDFFGTGGRRGLEGAQATFTISWVVERGVRRRHVDAARADLSLLVAERELRRLDAAAETARRYLASLAWQAREAHADQAVRIAQETIGSVARRVAAGRTPRVELFRAQAELARRRLAREAIDHERRSANRHLAAQWGEGRPAFARVEGDITGRPRIAPLETLKARLQQSPERLRLLSERRLREAELRLVLARERPSWHFNAGVRQDNASDDQALVAGIRIPFGERTRNPGRIAAARSRLTEVDRRERALRIRAETALHLLYEALQHRLHVIDALRREIIPPLEQALAETLRAYRLGRYSYLEWRTVQTELLEARNALVEAGMEAHLKMVEIERLTGVRLAAAGAPS